MNDLSGDRDLVENVKRVHRLYPTGVTIVTTMVDDVPYGLAVNAFSSLSIEPPTALVCVASTSATHPRLFLGETLAVNILAHDQVDVMRSFARSGGDKFSGLRWRSGQSGCPIIDGVSAHLELQIEHRLPAYTHTIFIGHVIQAAATGTPPLIYLGGQAFDSMGLQAPSEQRR
jgi:flavin reductase (DIM6/NTAB) family NADH-FMN oxidoreductase RutF